LRVREGCKANGRTRRQAFKQVVIDNSHMTVAVAETLDVVRLLLVRLHIVGNAHPHCTLPGLAHPAVSHVSRVSCHHH
jgi:hypothetical protein